MENEIWRQVEGIIAERGLREAVIESLRRLYRRRPERFREYLQARHIPKEDIVPLLGEYGDLVLEELRARGGPTKAPIQLIRDAEEYLRTIIELYGSEEEKRRVPLYPHVPKSRQPLFPHNLSGGGK